VFILPSLPPLYSAPFCGGYEDSGVQSLRCVDDQDGDRNGAERADDSPGWIDYAL
jgi:hypothetical protein